MTSSQGLNSFSIAASGGSFTGGTNSSTRVNPLYGYTLTYFANGNPKTSTDLVNSNWTYTYDEFSRLSTASR